MSRKAGVLRGVAVSLSVITGIGLTSGATIQSMAKNIQKDNSVVKQEILDETKASLKGVLYPLKVLSDRQITKDTYFAIIEFNTPMGKRDLPIVVIKNKGIVIGGYFENGVNVSASVMRKVRADKIKKAFPLLKREIQKSVMARYVPEGKVRGRLYVFVDPLCPFCENAETKLKGWADKYGYEIDLVPFIIHGEKAKRLTQSFICNNKKFDDYINKNYGKTVPNGCARSNEMLKDAYKAERKLGLAGTPTFITGKGNVVEGINYPKVEKLMSKGE